MQYEKRAFCLISTYYAPKMFTKNPEMARIDNSFLILHVFMHILHEIMHKMAIYAPIFIFVI